LKVNSASCWFLLFERQKSLVPTGFGNNHVRYLLQPPATAVFHERKYSETNMWRDALYHNPF